MEQSQTGERGGPIFLGRRPALRVGVLVGREPGLDLDVVVGRHDEEGFHQHVLWPQGLWGAGPGCWVAVGGGGQCPLLRRLLGVPCKIIQPLLPPPPPPRRGGTTDSVHPLHAH